MSELTSEGRPQTGLLPNGQRPRPVSAWNRIAGNQGRNLWFLAFALPFVAGLLVFVYIPIGWSAYLSFFDARATVHPTKFVGLANYRYLLGDPMFRSSIGTFVLFAAFIVPVTYVCSLGLALLLDGVRVGRAFFRSVFFIPTAVSYVVAAMVWRLSFFNGARFGLANSLLRSVGGENKAWLLGGDNYWYWFVVISLRLWLQVGFYMILIIAGLNRIPQDTYEAAAIDGATGWRKLRWITLPQLRTTTVAVLMLLLISAFQAFDEFFNLFGAIGSYPTFARPPLVHLYLLSLGGSQADLGLGGAGTMIVTALIVIFGLAQNWLLGRSERKESGTMRGSRP
ncbi:carbohydrate ABC transporter permease [Aestuariimicrobium kwangyangense]|uniref:carbohydrate ABC transporter permease n=1 Tax=Aestuariimicrobium kwangyangense TaxID=396389 RepID=UPI0003B473AB|nr:sugar ABC transporter permease [Aestuariimicrobium kwangyangense]